MFSVQFHPAERQLYLNNHIKMGISSRKKIIAKLYYITVIFNEKVHVIW